MSMMGYWNLLVRRDGWPWDTTQVITSTQDTSKVYRDPTCPKCGIVLGNKMMYCCPHSHCPVGLN